MDLQAAFDKGFDALKGYVDRSFDAYSKRIAVLEAAASDRSAMIEVVAAEVAKAVAALPAPAPGKSVTIDDVRPVIEEAVAKAVAALPAPAPGKSVTVDEVRPVIEEVVAKAVAALPAPAPGKSVTVDDVRPVIEELVAKAVAALPAPKDGSGIKGLLIDRDGELVATMDDGRVMKLGPVVGKDADAGAVLKLVAEAVAALPKAKDGIDGVGFDDLDLVESEDGVFLRFVKGDQVKSFRLPVVTDCGVYRDGKLYHRGNGVTWGGSFWIAQEETSEKPDTGKGWRLSVKRGRDGKDAKDAK